jgi:hypothetical protein
VPIQRISPIVAALLALSHGVLLYGSAGRDDAHITYWASKALADFGRIANLNGDAVEQSSSLLHVLILSASHAITGVSLPTLGVILSALFGVLTIVAAWRLAERLEIKSAWAVALFLSVFPYLIYWSFGGLETTLVSLIVVLTVYAVYDLLVEGVSLWRLSRASALIAAYVCARPEAVFVLLSYGAALGLCLLMHVRLARHRAGIDGRSAVVAISLVVLVSLITFVVLAAWRHVVFEQIFPQPVYAKVSGLHLSKILQGLRYVIEHFETPSLALLTILAVSLFVHALPGRLNRRQGLGAFAVAAFVVVYLAFTITSGGDWMEGGRRIVPLLPLIAILAVGAIDILPRHLRVGILSALFALTAWDTASFVRGKSTGIPMAYAASSSGAIREDFGVPDGAFSWFEYTNRVHLRDVPFVVVMDDVVRALIAAGRNRIVVLSTQAGMVPFHMAKAHYGKIVFIDKAGLSTRHLTDCRAARDLARSWAGISTTYDELFRRFELLSAECELERPDIIFDLDRPGRRRAIEDNGYVIVYSQTGEIAHALGGGPVRADQFIAVHEELYPFVSRGVPRSYRWPD